MSEWPDQHQTYTLVKRKPKQGMPAIVLCALCCDGHTTLWTGAILNAVTLIWTGIRIEHDDSGQFTYVKSKYEALPHASLRDTSIEGINYTV